MERCIFIICLLVLANFFNPIVFAEENAQNRVTFNKIISELNSVPIDKLADSIVGIEDRMKKYLEYNKRVCSGEFSSLVLSTVLGKGKTGQSKLNSSEAEVGDNVSTGKLTQEEKEACFKNLLEDNKVFVNKVFDKHKEFAKYLYETRLKNIDKARESKIKELTLIKAKGKRRRR